MWSPLLPPWQSGGWDWRWEGRRRGQRWENALVLNNVAKPWTRWALWPVAQQQVAIPAKVVGVLVERPPAQPPALIRDERPLAIDVEPKRGYDPVKVWLWVGFGWMALAGVVGIGVALSWKWNTTVYNITAAPAPIVAAAPPLPALAPRVLIVPAPSPTPALGTRPLETKSWTWIEYNPLRNPTELYGLVLGEKYTNALGAILQWAPYESNGSEYSRKHVTPDAPHHELNITQLLPDGMTAAELLNLYSLVPKKSLQAFIEMALDNSQKAQILAWLGKYETLATTPLPKEIGTSVQAARLAVKKLWDGYTTDPGVTLIVKYASPPLTSLQARAYLFQTGHAADLEKMKLFIKELRGMIQKQ